MNYVRTAENIVMEKRLCRHSWIPCLLQKRKCCSIVTTFQIKRKYDRSSDDVVTSTFYTPEIRPLYTPVDSHGTYGFRREPRRAACDRNRDCPRKHRGGAFSGARCSGQCAFRQRRNRAESHSLKLEYILFKPPAAKTAGGLFLPEVRLSAAKL